MVTKPPREAEEAARPQWVVAALHESGSLPDEGIVAGMDHVPLPEGFAPLDLRWPLPIWRAALKIKSTHDKLKK